MVRFKYLFWRESSYKRTEKISFTWHYPLLRESVSVFSIRSPRHKGRNILAAIFIDFSVIEMKVLQGHCHLLLAYGFSSHVNYFATFHFNSSLSLSGKMIILFLSVKIFTDHSADNVLCVQKYSALRIYFITFYYYLKISVYLSFHFFCLRKCQGV